jgi:hypothetical protein
MAEAFGYLISAARGVRDLQKRVSELEANQVTKYAGVWREGAAYARGTLVTHGGSIWHAYKDYPAKPGTSDSGWKLAVKRGAAS